MAHQNRLANTHVLVFGGTSGIGFAIANMALCYGARVTICGSTQPKVDSKIEKLRSLYPNLSAEYVAGFAIDLSDKDNLEANLKALLDQATQNGSKKIDHVAFTAGNAIPIGYIGDLDAKNFMDAFTVRFVAPSVLAKLLANGEYMPRASTSSITLTGGTNTHRPRANWAIAASVGASVEGLVRGLAVDLSPIRANVVVPGAIETELLEGLKTRATPEVIEKMKKSYSLSGEFGQPEDIAEAYGWVMKDRFANGAMVTSDGGRLLVTE